LLKDENSQTFTLAGAVDENVDDGDYSVTVKVFGTDNDSSATATIKVKHKPLPMIFELVEGADEQTVTAGNSIEPIVYYFRRVGGMSMERSSLPLGLEFSVDDDSNILKIIGTVDESLKDSTYTYSITVMGPDTSAVVTGTITVKHKHVETSVKLLDNASQTVKAGDSIKPIVFKYANMDSVAVLGLPVGSIDLLKDKDAQTLTLAGAVDETLRDGEYTVTVKVFGKDNDSAVTAKIVVNHKRLPTVFELTSNNAVQLVTVGDCIDPIVYRYENITSTSATLVKGVNSSRDAEAKTYTLSGCIPEGSEV
jgi:hypothetical protein